MNMFKCSDTKMQCIWKMLSSRRMFADHLEIAELSLKLDTSSNKSSSPVQTFKALGAGCILTIAAATRCWLTGGTGRWQLAASTTGALVLGAMAYDSYCYHDNLTKIARILATVESYDNAMKKMLLCINEMFYGNDRIGFLHGREGQKDLLVACVDINTKVIYELYGYVKILEAKMKLHNEFVKIYDPMESLDSCDVFQQVVFDQSTTKQLYNIFLYMQSHCLMLLTLSVSSDMQLGEVKIETNSLIANINRLTTELKKQFAMISASQVNVSNSSLHDQSRTIPKDLLAVKQQSLEFAAKLSVNIQHVVRLDQTIQSIENTDLWHDRMLLEEVVNNLVNFQSYFKTRFDECDRLIITIKKLLYATKAHTSSNADYQQSAPLEIDREDSFEKLLLDQQERGTPMDEFFLNTGTEVEDQENDDDYSSVMHNLEVENELVSKRLMKNRFKPVLAQLRQRLVPVEQSFKERERVALQLKGINLMDETETDNEESLPFNLDTDEEEECVEMAVKYEYRRSQNKYKEDRDFLASKPQLSLFASPPPSMAIQMEENILE